MKAPLTLAAFALAVFSFGCSGTESHGDGGERGGEHGRRSGEGEHGSRSESHDRDGSEHGGEGEEDGTEYAKDAIYDQTRNGANLILQYHAASQSFMGTVENVTDKVLEAVRVEVHLSNGKELGPTPAEDLAPGKQRPVILVAEGMTFEGWTAHPEVGRNEHGHEGGGEGGEGHK